jgi:hypothetical protein
LQSPCCGQWCRTTLELLLPTDGDCKSPARVQG